MKKCIYELYSFNKPMNKRFYADDREEIIRHNPDVTKTKGWYLKFIGFASVK